MKTQNGLLFVLMLISVNLLAEAPPLTEAPPDVISLEETCRHHLVRQSMREKQYVPWTDLAQQLNYVRMGTMLVRLKLTGASPSLNYLMTLSKPAEGLQIPDGLTSIHSDGLIFLAHGPAAALARLNNRIQNSPAAPGALFQMLDFSLTIKPSPATLPTIRLDEGGDLQATEREIALGTSSLKQFAVYNINEDQHIYFLPREEVKAASEFLKSQRVNQIPVTAPPVSWARWLVRRSEDFDKKTILLVGDWAVTAEPAYRALMELERTILRGAPPKIEVESGLLETLSRCYGMSCSVPDLVVTPPPSVTAPDSPQSVEESSAISVRLTPAVRERINDYLKRNRGQQTLSKPYGLRLVFLELAKLVPDKDSAEAYKAKIRAKAWMATDSQLPSKKAEDRYTEAWFDYLQANKNSFAEKPLTFSNVIQSIRLLPGGDD